MPEKKSHDVDFRMDIDLQNFFLTNNKKVYPDDIETLLYAF